MSKPLQPLALRHPADDPRIRALLLKFYENCADYQNHVIEAEVMLERRQDIVHEMEARQPR